MKLEDFAVGDQLILTARMRDGDDKRVAIVTAVNFNGNGLVTFAGDYERGGMLPTGSGAFDPTKVGTKPFGLVAVEKVGHIKPRTPWYPRPGDRGYDLMC